MSWLISDHAQRWKGLTTGLFAGLWLADVATTLVFTQRWGVEAEGNPLMHWVLVHWGSMGFIALKAAVLVLWCAMHQRIAIWWHVFLVLVFIPVIWINTLAAWF